MTTRELQAIDQFVESVKLYAALVASSLSRLHVLANPMVRLVFLRQIYFTAVRSLRLLSVAAPPRSAPSSRSCAAPGRSTRCAT